MNRLVAKFVDQAIAVNEAFAYLKIVQLRHDTPEFGLHRQRFAQSQDALGDLLSVGKGISADVIGDTVDIVQGLRDQIRV